MFQFFRLKILNTHSAAPPKTAWRPLGCRLASQCTGKSGVQHRMDKMDFEYQVTFLETQPRSKTNKMIKFSGTGRQAVNEKGQQREQTPQNWPTRIETLIKHIQHF